MDKMATAGCEESFHFMSYGASEQGIKLNKNSKNVRNECLLTTPAFDEYTERFLNSNGAIRRHFLFFGLVEAMKVEISVHIRKL